MQMGRWFGYRRNYELMPRIWMTSDTCDKFRFLSELEVDLRADLKKYMISDVTPLEYGPRILSSPKVSWLRLTSKNHMRNAKAAEMDFSGAKPQTFIFDNDIAIQQKNIGITEAFIQGLGSPEVSENKTGLFWTDVKLDKIMSELLINKFSFSNRSRVFNEIGVFCDWIKQIASENSLANWTVILAGNDTVKMINQAEDSHHWIAAGYQLGKVNRSRRKPKDDMDMVIDIGALRALRDHIADIDPHYVKEPITLQDHVDTIRKAAGKDKIPLLIIYRIDKDSKKRVSSEDRQDLNFGCDIMGLQICVPGDQVNKDFCKKLTIQLPEKDKEDEVEENE